MASRTDTKASRRDATDGPAVGEALVRAILEHHTVAFDYRGVHRVVEPHLLGVHEAGEAVLVAYQTGGESERELPGWRTFIVAEIDDVASGGRSFPGARADFDRAAHGMTEIFARA